MLKRISSAVKAHKIITALVVAAVAYGGYRYQQSANDTAAGETRYVLATATKGTLITTVSGTGQVVADQQVEVKPKASGRLASVRVAKGDTVKEGQVLATLDASDANKAVRDAQLSLETAQLSYDKLVKAADEDDLYSAQAALVTALDAVTAAEEALARSYESGFTDVSTAFLKLPDVMTGLEELLHGTDMVGYQANIDQYKDRIEELEPRSPYASDALASYDTARAKYDTAFALYKGTSRASDELTIETLVRDTNDATTAIAEAVKSITNMIQFYVDKMTERGKNPSSQAAQHLSKLSGYTSTLNGEVQSLTAADRAFNDARQGIVQAQRTVADRTHAIEEIKEGADAFDVRTQQLAVDQRKEALNDARAALADYSVTAPFAGTVAELEAVKGDQVSTSTAIATIVTTQKIAEISLSEVDVAKVAVGQAATLTFDALPELTISGKVADIDALGASSQGVVTYTVSLSLDTQDDRIKPSMTVSASIITQAKTDVLLVPSSAVKSMGETKYVQMVKSGEGSGEAGAGASRGVPLSVAPVQTTVTVGSSNDESIEILSGLSEGDVVVTSVIQGSATGAPVTPTTGGGQGGSVFGIPGAGASSGGMRMQLR